MAFSSAIGNINGGRVVRLAMISVHGNPLVSDSELGMDGKGGQNIYVREVGRRLSELGMDVTWMTRSESESEAGVVELTDRLRCRFVVAGPREHVHRDRLHRHLDAFTAAIAPGDFDAVFTCYWLSAAVGMSLGLPHVHAAMSQGRMKYRREIMPEIGPTRLKIEELISRTAEIYICQTRGEMELMQPRNPVFVPCGIDTEMFENLDRSVARGELGFGSDRLNVLYVGRFAEQKGYRYALEAMANTAVPHAFRLVGDHRGAIADVGCYYKSCQFLGPKEPKQVALMMAASDILIMPSLYEPFGLVAIEAMAAGCCLIVSAVDGLEENVLEGVNGLKVPPGDATAIRAAFETLAKDEERRNRMSRVNRRHALKTYSWKSVAVEIRQELNKIGKTC